MVRTDNAADAAADHRPALKVQIVSTYYAPETTGNAPYATSLAEGLARRGHDVHVVAAAPHYPSWAIWPDSQWRPNEIRNGVHVQRASSYVPKKPNFLSRILYEVAFGLRFAVRTAPDADAVVLLSPSLFGSLVVRLSMALRRRRIPTILWIQDLYSVGVKETPGRGARSLGALLSGVEGALARGCDRVVVIHERFRRVTEDHLGVAPHRLDVVRNWTHVTPVVNLDRASFRNELGWSPGETVVLHAGNMGAKQGLGNVVEAAKLAEARNLPLRFVLLGDGNQRSTLEAAGSGCSRLQFLDPLQDQDFVGALAAADVLLVNERPSLNEAAVPSKLTTYFATGRPVVAATDSSSTTADEIRTSRAGRIIPPADPERLVAQSLRVSGEWSDADAEAGPEFVRRHLSVEAGVGAFESLLWSIVAGRPAVTNERKT